MNKIPENYKIAKGWDGWYIARMSKKTPDLALAKRKINHMAIVVDFLKEELGEEKGVEFPIMENGKEILIITVKRGKNWRDKNEYYY